MRVWNGLEKVGTRLSHPLLALLIAVIAAVGAIAQCGLLLDAATQAPAAVSKSSAAKPAPAGRFDELGRLATAAHAVPPTEDSRPD